MKILVTGGTGFIGQALIRELFLRGHDVVLLSRHPELAAEGIGFPVQAYSWRTDHEPPAAAFAGVEAVFHLAGEPIANRRWSSAEKEKILKSRILGTKNLMEYLARGKTQVKFVLSASAIGIYGDRGGEELTEISHPGTGFLANVCEAWERELFSPAIDPEVRRVALRTGIVLGAAGGMLKKLLPIFRAGLGGRVGSGKQWMSWISREDLVGLMLFALENPEVRGVINGTSPEPVRAGEFARELAAALGKKALFPAPSFAIKTALGEMATLVLSGQKVLPAEAMRLGYRFQFPNLREYFAREFLRSPGCEGAERFTQEQWIARPRAEVFSFFSEARNLEVLTPTWLNFTILSQSTPVIGEGSVFEYRIVIHGVPVRWRTLIEVWKPGEGFVDVQTKGPYALWRHEHQFTDVRGGVLMRDSIDYKVPVGVLGRIFAGRKIGRDVAEIFSFRMRKIRKIFGA